MALQITVKLPQKGRPSVDVEALILKIFYEAPKALGDEKLADFLGYLLW